MLQDFIDFGDCLIRHFLYFILRTAFIIFRNSFIFNEFFQGIIGITTHITDRYFGALTFVTYNLGQVASTLFRHKELGEGLQQAMLSRATIEQAKGILMARHKLTADAAFDLLRKASSHRNVKLRTLAEQIVETGELEE